MSKQLFLASGVITALAFWTLSAVSQTTVSPPTVTGATPEIIERGGSGKTVGPSFGAAPFHFGGPAFGRHQVKTYSLPSASATEVSKDLPMEAMSLVSEYTRESSAIQKRANCETHKLRVALRQRLKDLQDKYTREAKLDEAVAIRDQIRALQIPPGVLITDPIPLWDGTTHIGQVFFFRVTGTTGGSVWGSDLYTADSTIASVAVHAGVLKPGQSGIVKVTVLPGQPAYNGAIRNGVTGRPYDSYPMSIKVEAAFDDSDCDAVSDAPAIKSESPATDTSRPRKAKKANRENKRKNAT